MHLVTEIIDPLHGETIESRLSLLTRESLRRRRDRTLKTRLLNLLDMCLGLGHWWFPNFVYECRNPDGSLWKRHEVRNTLAGYTIAWGRYSEFNDDGGKLIEGINHTSALTGKSNFRQHQYWLPDGVNVSQQEWMRYTFGPEADLCHDPTWER